jgi:hypothetical protein
LKIRDALEKGIISSLTSLKNEMLEKWLREVKDECLSPVSASDHNIFGGAFFNSKDNTTYWTRAAQFHQWWSANIEKKSKYESFIFDAAAAKTLKTKDIQR